MSEGNMKNFRICPGFCMEGFPHKVLKESRAYEVRALPCSQADAVAAIYGVILYHTIPY